MKICYWTIFPNTYQTALLEALRAAGVDVVACYFGRYDASRTAMGWKMRELFPWEHAVDSVAAARRAIPDFDARTQVVTAFFNLTYWRLIRHCLKKRIPWFVVTEGTRGRWFMRPLFNFFARLADRHAQHVFAIGQAAVEQFRRAGVRSEKVSWISYVTPAPPKNLPPRDKALTFVFAGSLSARKAIDVIDAAFARVREAYPDVRLLVVGDGPLRAVLEGRLGVELVGAVAQDAVYRHIARGHAMLLPSRYDPWGVSLVEGAMCGQAMIGSDCTGAARDLVEDGVNGYLVKAGDVDALARAMSVYAEKPGLAELHGSAARAAAQRTGGATTARRILSVLEGAQ